MCSSDIVNGAGGTLVTGRGEAAFSGVSIDSRGISGGEIFFAVRGDRFDGHDFVSTLPERGAGGAVVSKGWEGLSTLSGLPHDFCLITVDDTRKALGDAAKYWRERHPIPLAAVSGSCGKSTTKEMIAAIMGVKREVLKTEGNRNNLLGLPLTILDLNESHQVGVVELGISEEGEMTRLAEIAKPDVALLTNIGISHISSLGSFQGVARAKGELFHCLKPDGTEVINFDDLWIVEMTAKSKRRKITYSVEEKADVCLKGYEAKGSGYDGMIARFSLFDEEIAVEIRGIGSYNLSNAAAAIATASALGAEPDEIVEGLSHYIPMKNRMEPLHLNGVTLLDDTYNANPDSMETALRTLSEFRGRRIAVLGDMLELGDIARDVHRRIGGLASRLGVERLVLYGEFKGEMYEGAVDEGMDGDAACTVKSKDDAVEMLRKIVRDGDVVLVKGSRGMGMEDVVEKFRERLSTKQEQRITSR